MILPDLWSVKFISGEPIGTSLCNLLNSNRGTNTRAPSSWCLGSTCGSKGQTSCALSTALPTTWMFTDEQRVCPSSCRYGKVIRTVVPHDGWGILTRGSLPTPYQLLLWRCREAAEGQHAGREDIGMTTMPPSCCPLGSRGSSESRTRRG